MKNRKHYLDEQGRYHRIGGPAIEDRGENKYEAWYIHGDLHRKDGPAIITDNAKEWWMNGEQHREDGPAVIYSSGSREWFIRGQELSEEEFNNKEYIAFLIITT